MSTSNFIPNPEPFPIWAIEDDAPELSAWACPNCSDTYCNDPVFVEDDGNGSYTCPVCGCSTSHPEEDALQWLFDGDIAREWADGVNAALSAISSELEWFALELKPGYYSGFQILVKPDGDAAEWDPDDPDALAECAGYRDEDPADVARSYARERDGLARCLAEELPGYGFEPYRVAARFDNGETWYRVDEKE